MSNPSLRSHIAALCDEIERLRAEVVAFSDIDSEKIDGLVAERDAALTECERLRANLAMTKSGAECVRLVLEKERDAALARNIEIASKLAKWRECADRLVNLESMEDWVEALAVYERLKDAS